MAYELVGREARAVKSTSVLENGLRELAPDVRDVWLAREDDVIVAAVLHAMPVGRAVAHHVADGPLSRIERVHGVRDGLQG